MQRDSIRNWPKANPAPATPY